MMPMESAPATERRSSLVSRWNALSSRNRRRIVLASLFGMALAARDLILLMVAAGMFALSELGATHRPLPSAA